MKLCVYGAGGVGGGLAVPLALSGVDVSLVARGAHGEAIARDGLTVVQGESRRTARVRVSADPAALGVQDVVIVTVKATDPAGLAASLPPLLGPDTAVVFAQNGIPWWYAHGLADAANLPDLARLDPGGALARSVGARRAIGCVIYAPMEVVSPGVVRINGTAPLRFVLGEPDGSTSARVAAIARAFEAAGHGAPVVADIRREIWKKLLLNAAQSPICCLIGASINAIGPNAALRALANALVGEVSAVAAAYGVKVALDKELEIGSPGLNLVHKPSMLQDLEKGRPLEIDAMLAAVQDFARARAVATPNLDVVTGLLIGRATVAGLYR
ncbi:MAG: 2-dehydropantoate 2-reductase [Alphaproteobacteria bacterium]|nr:2-dehydropantoate 2-reductase [Alphaproteobacteria bacterium]